MKMKYGKKNCGPTSAAAGTASLTGKMYNVRAPSAGLSIPKEPGLNKKKGY
jgi:hypothetical protein